MIFLAWKDTIFADKINAISKVVIDNDAVQSQKSEVVKEMKKCLEETISNNTKEFLKREPEWLCNGFMLEALHHSFNKMVKMHNMLTNFLGVTISPMPDNNIRQELEPLFKAALKELKGSILNFIKCIELFLRKGI